LIGIPISGDNGKARSGGPCHVGGAKRRQPAADAKKPQESANAAIAKAT